MPVEVLVRGKLTEHRAVTMNTPVSLHTLGDGELCILGADTAYPGELVVKMFDSYVQFVSAGLKYIQLSGSTKVHRLSSGDAITLVVR